MNSYTPGIIIIAISVRWNFKGNPRQLIIRSQYIFNAMMFVFKTYDRGY